MLNTNSYVTIIPTDFSKAFDTVRHVTLLGPGPTYLTTSVTGLSTF